MAADKPLQDIFSTVRLPVTDAIISVGGGSPVNTTSSIWMDYGGFYNCYPQFFSDRSSNQYSSQFDTWAEKRSPISQGVFTDIGNGTVPTANITVTMENMCMTQLDDVYVAAIADSTAGLIRIIQYKPIAGTSLQIGTIAGGTSADTVYLTELVVTNTPCLGVIFVNAAESTSLGAYAQASSSSSFTAASLTTISDVDFPANLASTIVRGAMVQLDGYTCVMSKQGGVYNSVINSISSWLSTMVVQANAYPDQGVGLARYKNHIVAFGEDSIEFFNDVGNPSPASPLGRTDQAFIKFGCNWGKSLIAVDDTVYWLASSSRGKQGLWKLDGYTPVKVSSLRDDILMSQGSPLYGNANGFIKLLSYTDHGKQHLMTDFNTALQLVYEVTDTTITQQPTGTGYPSDPMGLASLTNIYGGWLTWDLQTGTSWLMGLGASSRYLPLQAINAPIINVANTGGIYPVLMGGQTSFATMSNKIYYTINSPANAALGTTANFQDFGSNNIMCAVQFNVWDFNNEKRKRIHRIKIIQRQYGASALSTTQAPWTWVVYSKTDGDFNQNTSTITKLFKRVCKQDYRIARTYINNLGAARKWYIAVVQCSDMPFSLRGIELDISQGT